MGKGRLEAQITVPAGGWDVAINDSGAGGDVTATLAAGNYYLPELLVALASALNVAATTDTLTVQLSNSESGTGKVQITSTGAGTITWVDADLRDLLGYTTNLTLVANTANVAPNCARSMWLPDCTYDADNDVGDWLGWPEIDAQSQESVAGDVFAIVNPNPKEVAWLRWAACSRPKAVRAQEVNVNESFQRFLEDGVWGLAAWGQPTGPIRFFPDANAGDYVEYAVVLPDAFKPSKWVDGWAGGPWTCQIERLVAQSSGVAATAARQTVTFTHRETASSTTDGTVFTTGSFTPAAGKLQVLDIDAAHASLAETPTSVVGCGLTWVREKEVYHGTGGATVRRLSRWRAMGSSPSTGPLTITFANPMASVVWSWNEATGADTSGANGAGAFVQSVAQGFASATTLSSVLAAFEHANNVHLCAVGTNAGVAVTPDAQFAELGDDTEVTLTAGLETQWAVNETSCDPTFTASISAAISSEIKAAYI